MCFSRMALLISSFRSRIWKWLKFASWMRDTFREISFSTWPLHFSHVGIELTSVMTFGRRARPASITPRSAACWARKRKSIDCAFSELRACIPLGLLLERRVGDLPSLRQAKNVLDGWNGYWLCARIKLVGLAVEIKLASAWSNLAWPSLSME